MGAFLDRLLAVCEPESRVISARQGKNTDGTLMGWWELGNCVYAIAKQPVGATLIRVVGGEEGRQQGERTHYPTR